MKSLNYWKLNYKDKYYRTLMTTPFVMAVLIYIWISDKHLIINMAFSISIISLYIGQLIYNYKKYKPMLKK